MQVVYDTYVKPPNEITDYLTKFSGITPELMENCTTTLEDVQRKFLGVEGGEGVHVLYTRGDGKQGALCLLGVRVAPSDFCHRGTEYE